MVSIKHSSCFGDNELSHHDATVFNQVSKLSAVLTHQEYCIHSSSRPQLLWLFVSTQYTGGLETNSQHPMPDKNCITPISWKYSRVYMPAKNSRFNDVATPCNPMPFEPRL